MLFWPQQYRSVELGQHVLRPGSPHTAASCKMVPGFRKANCVLERSTWNVRSCELCRCLWAVRKSWSALPDFTQAPRFSIAATLPTYCWCSSRCCWRCTHRRSSTSSRKPCFLPQGKGEKHGSTSATRYASCTLAHKFAASSIKGQNQWWARLHICSASPLALHPAASPWRVCLPHNLSSPLAQHCCGVFVFLSWS